MDCILVTTILRFTEKQSYKKFYESLLKHLWSRNVARSLIKEPKIYLWDWFSVKNSGQRAENFIACHLLKAVHLWTDLEFGKFDLCFLRDKSQREVDFLVTKGDEPGFLVEVKKHDKTLSPSLKYFQNQLNAPHAF